MNRIKYAATQCRLLILAILVGMVATPQANASISAEMERTIENRILSLGSSVDVRYSPEVRKRIKQYLDTQRNMSEVLIGRSMIYFPEFETILREKGLPDDLKYLAVIESGLRPSATSRIGAAGLWQFMRPTGRMMGLKITRTVDERRDIEKSTKAAAEYLLKLYNQFDDWTLALAAYNCGPGNLRKAIRKSGGKRSFWEIEKYLPRETRNYVPKFIAMQYVMNYYYDHDITPKVPNEVLMNTSRARVFENINLKKLSKELEIDFKTMKVLNPSFVRNQIPGTEEGKYYLVLPTDDMRVISKQYHVLAELPLLPEEMIDTRRTPIHVTAIPAALYIQSATVPAPSSIKPMYMHPVSFDSRKQRIPDTMPEAYKIDDIKSKTIPAISAMIKSTWIKT